MSEPKTVRIPMLGGHIDVDVSTRHYGGGNGGGGQNVVAPVVVRDDMLEAAVKAYEAAGGNGTVCDQWAMMEAIIAALSAR